MYKAEEALKERLLSMGRNLLGYVGKIAINLRSEQVNIIIFGELYSWELVPQSDSLWEESVRVDRTSQRWNTKCMDVAGYNDFFFF